MGVSRDRRGQKVCIDRVVDLIPWSQHVAPIDRGVSDVELNPLGQLIAKGRSKLWHDAKLIAIVDTDVSAGLSQQATDLRCSIPRATRRAFDLQPLARYAHTCSRQRIERPITSTIQPLEAKFHAVELIEGLEVVANSEASWVVEIQGTEFFSDCQTFVQLHKPPSERRIDAGLCDHRSAIPRRATTLLPAAQNVAEPDGSRIEPRGCLDLNTAAEQVRECYQFGILKPGDVVVKGPGQNR